MAKKQRNSALRNWNLPKKQRCILLSIDVQHLQIKVTSKSYNNHHKRLLIQTYLKLHTLKYTAIERKQTKTTME